MNYFAIFLLVVVLALIGLTVFSFSEVARRDRECAERGGQYVYKIGCLDRSIFK